MGRDKDRNYNLNKYQHYSSNNQTKQVMKKLVLAVLALGAVAACTKSNVQYEQPGEISLHPVAQKATKVFGAIDGNEYDPSETFNVWAWWSNADPAVTLTEYTGYTTQYINQGTFINKADSWGGKISYYWPTTGSLVFAGYSPASVSSNGTYNYVPATKTLTISGFRQPSDVTETIDLMWFDITDGSYRQNPQDSGVPVVFQHALSWLTFNFNLKDANTPQSWEIKSVQLKNIETQGDFDAVKGNDEDTKWKSHTDTKDITVYSSDPEAYKLTYDADGTILENTTDKNGVLIIPQSCAPASGTTPAAAELYIEYILTANSAPITTNITLPLNPGEDDTEWKPGKHYTYNITFGAKNEILISPTVTDWAEYEPAVDLDVQ